MANYTTNVPTSATCAGCNTLVSKAPTLQTNVQAKSIVAKAAGMTTTAAAPAGVVDVHVPSFTLPLALVLLYLALKR